MITPEQYSFLRLFTHQYVKIFQNLFSSFLQVVIIAFPSGAFSLSLNSAAKTSVMQFDEMMLLYVIIT